MKLLFLWNKMAHKQFLHKEIYIKNVMQLLKFDFEKYI